MRMSVGLYRFSSFMRVTVEQSSRGVSEFRMDMSVISTRMFVVERANLRQPKR